MRKQNFIVDKAYLYKHPNHIFVFGDNTIRMGYGGAAILRDMPNTYGFITKKYPDNDDESFYDLTEYPPVFKIETEKLLEEIQSNPDKTFLISQLGGGLANRFGIWEKIIKPSLEKKLANFDNVVLLWD